jgi:hypothetical protein
VKILHVRDGVNEKLQMEKAPAMGPIKMGKEEKHCHSMREGKG